MNRKIRVGLICGGISCEHDVSLASAKNVLAAIDSSKYEVGAFLIDKKGKWHAMEAAALIEESSEKLLLGNASLKDLEASNKSLACVQEDFDVVFPLLHGLYGEDGTVQGLLKLMRVPFVGASVLGSAIGMDKDVMKRLLREAGLPVGKFLTITAARRESINVEKIIEDFGLPLFVKPANSGSSLGISKARNKEELQEAIAFAFQYDSKILIEESIVGRELECAVLGNERPMASTVGEVITSYEFYNYEAKYLDQKLRLEIPANISQEEMQRTQKLALRAFEVLCCEGMARVDFFLKANGELLINEINTIPGFTSSSMYPKLWEASGISYSELIDRLIELAIERKG